MNKFVGLLFVFAFLAFAACGSDSSDSNSKNTTNSTNSKNTTNSTNSKNTTNSTNSTNSTNTVKPPEKLDCDANSCTGFVFNKLLLPADATQANEYGVDFNKDGDVDNQLGNILSALAGFVSDLALQPSVDAAVNEGATIILLKVQGDLANEEKAAAQAWLGKETACCETKDNPETCAEEAAAGCFAGTHEFSIDPAGPTDAIFGGSVKDGKGLFGPSKFQISIPLATGTLTLMLQQAQIHATFKDGKITSGKLAGGITEKDLNDFVLPSVHKMLEDSINEDPTSSTAKQILQIFDANDDGKVALEEVTGNELIKGLLQGDVDVDGDGTDELSLGVGFEAVGATITE